MVSFVRSLSNLFFLTCTLKSAFRASEQYTSFLANLFKRNGGLLFGQAFCKPYVDYSKEMHGLQEKYSAVILCKILLEG